MNDTYQVDEATYVVRDRIVLTFNWQDNEFHEFELHVQSSEGGDQSKIWFNVTSVDSDDSVDVVFGKLADGRNIRLHVPKDDQTPTKAYVAVRPMPM